MRHPSEQEEWVCVRSHLEGSCLSYLFSYELLVWNWQGLIRCEHGSLGVCTDSGSSVNTRVPLCRCLCRYRYLCAQVRVSPCLHVCVHMHAHMYTPLYYILPCVHTHGSWYVQRQFAHECGWTHTHGPVCAHTSVCMLMHVWLCVHLHVINPSCQH